MPNEDLPNRSFECGSIADELVASLKQAKMTKDPNDWQKFSENFELAFIWNTLMRKIGKWRFLSSNKSSKASGIIKYSVSGKKEILTVESRNVEKGKLKAGKCVVDVQYVDEDEKRVARRCEFTITRELTIRGEKLGEGIDWIKFSLSKTSVTCPEQILSVLKDMTTEEDLETCRFEYENIRQQLISSYKLANKEADQSNKQTRWNWFWRRFNLALIWDTLCGPDFFTPAEETEECTKCYRVEFRDEKLHFRSLEEGKKLKFEQKKLLKVIVDYDNPIYGEVRQTCTFVITKENLCEVIEVEASECELSTFTLSEEIVFEKPKMDHIGSVRNRLDKLIVEKERKEHLKHKIEDDLKTLYDKTWEKKERESECFEQEDAKTAGKGKMHLGRVTIKMRERIEEIKHAEGRKDLEEAFVDCAKVHFAYCDVVEEFKELEETWKAFLDTACSLYDNLLAWSELHYWPYQKNREKPKSFDKLRFHSKECRICPSRVDAERDFEDKRKEGKYQVHHVPKESEFCDVRNVIYLATCCKCEKRYVGKTVNSIKDRYASVKRSDKRKKHLEEHGKEQGENFRILQIVDEENLFSNNESFKGFHEDGVKDYLKTNPTDLEGVEKLWIDRLICEDDLNDHINFKYSDDHRSHLSVLLRQFIRRHEIKYVLAPKTKRSTTSTRGVNGVA